VGGGQGRINGNKRARSKVKLGIYIRRNKWYGGVVVGIAATSGVASIHILSGGRCDGSDRASGVAIMAWRLGMAKQQKESEGHRDKRETRQADRCLAWDGALSFPLRLLPPLPARYRAPFRCTRVFARCAAALLLPAVHAHRVRTARARCRAFAPAALRRTRICDSMARSVRWWVGGGRHIC